MTEPMTDEEKEEAYQMVRISVYGVLAQHISEDDTDILSNTCKFLLSDECDEFYRMPHPILADYTMPSGLALSFLDGYKNLMVLMKAGVCCYHLAALYPVDNILLAFILTTASHFYKKGKTYNESLIPLIMRLGITMPDEIHEAVINHSLDHDPHPPEDYICWVLAQVSYFLRQDRE